MGISSSSIQVTFSLSTGAKYPMKVNLNDKINNALNKSLKNYSELTITCALYEGRKIDLYESFLNNQIKDNGVIVLCSLNNEKIKKKIF